MEKTLKIGTRESQLALWQATQVKDLLSGIGIAAELIGIKSEGDIDLKTPLYEIGVQGIFTRNLDAALLNHEIDIAVHSMKDVPTQLAAGLAQAAVLKRGSYKDILVFRDPAAGDLYHSHAGKSPMTIATSSIRRKAQWLHRYPDTRIVNLRGNVNTRLDKLALSNWNGAIFAAAGLERTGLRPSHAIDLDWMLPAPAQGAITILCREEDRGSKEACLLLNDPSTALCTKIERDFLRALMGGCSTPISALAEIEADELFFRASILSADGKQKKELEKILPMELADNLGIETGKELLDSDAAGILEKMRHGAK
jgi:hydroxymethylbilane synthase